MANIVFNIAKGRVVEFYNRVKSGDPADSALVLIPIETDGLESDAVLIDKDTVADVLSGDTDEQTTMGRKVPAAAELDGAPWPADGRARDGRALPGGGGDSRPGGARACRRPSWTRFRRRMTAMIGTMCRCPRWSGRTPRAMTSARSSWPTIRTRPKGTTAT